jgi:serine phosphatase RsbU (regulator of sigma subunit)
MTDGAGHILIVDDHKTNRIKMSFAVKKLGHTVDNAENGRQALEMLRTQAFDLVLLDIVMPEMNGYQVLEQMKKDQDLRDIPVIVISAETEMAKVVKGIELGAEDYLPKSFDPALLKARVEASLRTKWLRDFEAENTRLLDMENQRKSDELEQLRKIQLAMLPHSPPTLPHLEVAAHQETASEVGGDYYDFFPQSNGNLRIAIGDATGHGAGSASMVSMTKASLLATNEPDLNSLVMKINKILNEVDLGLQLNMALLLLEMSELPGGGVNVRACGGGMPPIYVLRATGRVEEILISGLPLGITDKAVYEVTEFQLQSNDSMLLISDGLLEMFNGARQYLGFDHLVTALTDIDATTQTAEAVLKRIAQIGKTWANGHPLHDDVTFVVMQAK